MIYLKGWLYRWLVMDHSVHMKIKPTLQINLVWVVLMVVPSADSRGSLLCSLSSSLPVFRVCYSSLLTVAIGSECCGEAWAAESRSLA